MIERMRQLYLMLTGHRLNSVTNNKKVWSKWDWSQYGEEWSNNEEWKASVVQEILNYYIPEGKTVLEIGPGGGRWTEHLLKKASRLVLVDLTPECIDLCKERFTKHENIEYYINEGNDLPFISDCSIDCIWSWDVFVHISSRDIENYVEQFSRVLKNDGIAVIHHSRNGLSRTGWRSDMTAQKMIEYCTRNCLTVERQFEQWMDGKHRIWPGLPLDKCPDTVSIIRKPS